jgi:hypothetical protein
MSGLILGQISLFFNSADDSKADVRPAYFPTKGFFYSSVSAVIGVARFSLIQLTKTEKIHQMATKYNK